MGENYRMDLLVGLTLSVLIEF